MKEISLFCIAFVGSVGITPLMMRMFKRHGIMDTPGGRKLHFTEKPTMGGVGIFAGLIIAISLWHLFYSPDEYLGLFISVSMIFLIGLADDLFALRARYKFLGQTLAILILMFVANAHIPSLYGVLGVYSIPAWLGTLLTFFTILAITNAMNLLDGIDGLSGSIGLTFCLFTGVWFISTEAHFEAAVACALAGGILGFLLFNWAPSRIFMGDTGALLIGFIIAWLAIRFLNHNQTLPSIHYYQASASVAIAIAALIVPLFDTLRVFSIRIWQKRSPFSGDKIHLHHLFLRYFQYSHQRTTLILAGTNLSILILIWQMRWLPPNMAILLVLVLSLSLYFVLIKMVQNAEKKIKKRRNLSNRTMV